MRPARIVLNPFAMLGAVFLAAPVAPTHANELFDLTQNCVQQFGGEWFGAVRTADGAPLCARTSHEGFGQDYREIDASALCPGGHPVYAGRGALFSCAEGSMPVSDDPAALLTPAPELDPLAPAPAPDGLSPAAPPAGLPDAISPDLAPSIELAPLSRDGLLTLALTVKRCADRFGPGWTAMPMGAGSEFDASLCVAAEPAGGNSIPRTYSLLDYCAGLAPAYLPALDGSEAEPMAHARNARLGACRQTDLSPPPCPIFGECPAQPPPLPDRPFTAGDLCPEGDVRLFAIAESGRGLTANYYCTRALEGVDVVRIVFVTRIEDSEQVVDSVSDGSRVVAEVEFTGTPDADQQLLTLDWTGAGGEPQKLSLVLYPYAEAGVAAPHTVYRSHTFLVWLPLDVDADAEAAP